MKKNRSFWGILFLGSLVAFLPTCAGDVALNGIVVNPASPSIPAGATQQFKAQGYFNDASNRDVSGEVSWTSSNAAVAIIDSTGLARAVGPGTTTISAISSVPSSYSTSGSTGSTILTVYAATLLSISVTPANPSLPVGVTRQFTATGAYSDGSSFDITSVVAWSSDNPGVATVNSAGLATSLASGTATITAASGGISGNTTLTTNSATLSSLSITPASASLPSIPAGVTRQFTATGSYSDGTSFDITTLVTWASSNAAVATMSSAGLATALTPGTVTLTATSGSISENATLTVTSAALTSISVTPLLPLITVGAKLQMKATGIYADGTSYDITNRVTWTSSNTAQATVGSTGLVSAVAAGTPTLTATFSTVSGNTILSVTSG